MMNDKNDILLSIIIPVYNSQNFLKLAIDSIIENVSKKCQIIIVDDGSTDDSGRIADDYAHEFHFVEVVHTTNCGVSHARNIGMKYATGEWLFFLDSDDQIINDLSILLNSHQSSQADMIVFSSYFRYIQENYVKKKSAYASIICSDASMNDYLRQMNQECKDVFLNYLWCRLFRRKIICDNCIEFNEEIKLGEDFLFITSFLQSSNRVMVVEEAFYSYYIRGESSLVFQFDMNEANRRETMRKAFENLLYKYGIEAYKSNVFLYNEGMNLVSSIRKSFSQNCDLRNYEKIKYIRSFLDEKNRDIMKYYLRRRKSIFNRLILFGVSINSVFVIYISCLGQCKAMVIISAFKKIVNKGRINE